MIIDWKDPSKELPEDGAFVAIIIYHNKSCWPQSAEIYFGEVDRYVDKESGNRKVYVFNNDFIGSGNANWDFCNEDDDIAAWCYAKEFQRPSFIDHDPHWGKESL